MDKRPISCNGAEFIYEYLLDIDANGFFSAQVTDLSDLSSPVVYSGNGNCGSSQCQMSIALSNGVLQKSVIFNADGSLSCFGAIYYNDGTPNIQWGYCR